MSLVGIEFSSLGVLHLGEVTDEHSQVIALPGEGPLRITIADLKQFILLGIADSTEFISTNRISGTLNEDTWRNPATGAVSSNPGWTCTDIMEVGDPGTADWAVGGYGSVINVLCYDNTGTFISSPALTTITGGKTFEAPFGTRRIALNISNTGETSFPTLQLNEGNVLLDYEPPNYFFLKIKDSALVDYYNKTEIDGFLSNLDNEILDINERILTIEFQVEKNHLNPYVLRDNVWILSGSEGVIPGAKATTFLPVVPTTTYTISGLVKASTAKRINYYNAAKEIIGGAEIAPSGSGTMTAFTFTAGALVRFVSFQLKTDSESFAAGQMEIGSSATSFELYQQTAISVNGVPTLFASTGGGGGGSTNLSTAYSSTDVTIASSTGTDATINAATTSNAGVMSAADKTKIDALPAIVISGSMTSGYLQKANGTTTVNDSAIFQSSTQIVIGGTTADGSNVLTLIGTASLSGAIKLGVLAGSGSRMVVTDSSGVLSATTLPTSTSPGGSNGQIQFNSSSSFGGAANFYWDSTNNRVGINQASPAYGLDVNGTARIVTAPTITTATKMLVKDPTTGQISEQLLPAGGGSGWGLSGNAGTVAGTNFLGTTDNVDVVFKRGGSEVGRLYSDSVSFGGAVTSSNAQNTIVGFNSGTWGVRSTLFGTMNSVAGGTDRTIAIGNSISLNSSRNLGIGWDVSVNHSNSAILSTHSTAVSSDSANQFKFVSGSFKFNNTNSSTFFEILASGKLAAYGLSTYATEAAGLAAEASGVIFKVGNALYHKP